MTTRVIETETDRAGAIRLLESRKLPCTVTFKQGKHRSLNQNRLQRLWCNEAAEQLQDETAEEKRAFCKLHFAIPILRAESDEYCEAYDKYIRPLPYEAKLAMMAVPLDYPATRLMTSKQKTQYLDEMWQLFTAQGVKLTDPEELRTGTRRAS